jgi:hypothetical protein
MPPDLPERRQWTWQNRRGPAPLSGHRSPISVLMSVSVSQWPAARANNRASGGPSPANHYSPGSRNSEPTEPVRQGDALCSATRTPQMTPTARINCGGHFHAICGERKIRNRAPVARRHLRSSAAARTLGSPRRSGLPHCRLLLKSLLGQSFSQHRPHLAVDVRRGDMAADVSPHVVAGSELPVAQSMRRACDMPRRPAPAPAGAIQRQHCHRLKMGQVLDGL